MFRSETKKKEPPEGPQNIGSIGGVFPGSKKMLGGKKIQKTGKYSGEGPLRPSAEGEV